MILRRAAMLLLLALGGCEDVAPVDAYCPAVLPGWIQPGAKQLVDGYRPKLWVAMDGGKVTWNGKPVDRAGLDMRLKLVSDPDLQPAPYILFDPSGASDCTAAEDVRDEIDKVAQCGKRGTCGQGKAADFQNAISGLGSGKSNEASPTTN